VLVKKLPYDLERDFTPVSLVVISPYLLVVHPSVPARNPQELIALARSNPGKLNYASAGVGTSSHFLGELLNLMANVKIVHVPYKGGSGIGTATASGQIDVSFPTVAAAQPFVQSGKVRVLAITSANRMSLLASVPTLSESALPKYVVTGWVGILAPPGVPQEVIARLNAAVAKVVNTPEMKQALNKQGLEPQTNTPAQFSAFIRADIAQNVKFVELTGVRIE
jgi:tripartite-type tricarboxylate transporter receptor subunit TctC